MKVLLNSFQLCNTLCSTWLVKVPHLEQISFWNRQQNNNRNRQTKNVSLDLNTIFPIRKKLKKFLFQAVQDIASRLTNTVLSLCFKVALKTLVHMSKLRDRLLEITK